MFGTTLIIANPAARSGQAAEAAAQATSTLKELQRQGSVSRLDVRYTAAPGDGTVLAQEQGASCDTLVVIGGDGIVHEVLNGLMALPRLERPCMALVPCGNGDDLARSVGMERTVRPALERIASRRLGRRAIDVGCVDGRWFAETLSFGLDAAIALGTTDLRRRTGRTGTSLYVQCAVDQLANHRIPRRCTLSLDGVERDVEFYLLAVQNGPSYGGGFKICPNAHLDDGHLSIAYAKPTLSAPAALRLFAKARSGNHTTHPNLVFETARSVHIRLEEPMPTQIDGERLEGLEHTVELHPGELDVYFAV